MDFSLVPSDAIQPLFYAEVDASKAGGGVPARPTLIMGQRITDYGTATDNVPVRISGGAQGPALFGHGSQLARMLEFYYKADPFAEVWACPSADPGGVKANRDIVFVGTSTAAGTLHLYIGGRYLAIPVPTSSNATAVGQLVEDYLGANEAAAVAGVTLGYPSPFPVTASNAVGTVTLTARNAGLVGNTIDFRVNYLGAAAGQSLPAGITLGTTLPIYLTNGTLGPADLATSILALADERYSYIVWPWADGTSLDTLQVETADSTAGRWGPIRKLYGTAFTADNAAYATLADVGLATAKNNDPHCTALGIDACPTPADELAAVYAGACAVSLRNDRARPLNTLPLPGVLAPAAASRFNYAERDVLLKLGITTPIYSSDGTVRIQRAVSCRTLNAYGSSDFAYRDITTAETLDQCLTEMESLITSKYGRVKLVNDADSIFPGSAVATPSMVKADLVAQYRGWERSAYVEDTDTFANLLVVERNLTDPNRLDVLWQPDLANGLHIFAVLAAFRLQYSAAEVAGE